MYKQTMMGALLLFGMQTAGVGAEVSLPERPTAGEQAQAEEQHNAKAPGADMMTKSAPALKAPSGSKAESANTEGIAHYSQGHWDVARKHFQQALKADPNSAEAHYNLALALDKAGDHKTAIEHFQKAKELGSGNPEIQESKVLQAHLKPRH